MTMRMREPKARITPFYRIVKRHALGLLDDSSIVIAASQRSYCARLYSSPENW